MSARVRRAGAIQVHGVTTWHDVVWQIGNGPTRETKADEVIRGRDVFGYGHELAGMECGEFVNESDLGALHDALNARNRGETDPLCLSCHRASVVYGLDVCSGCNDHAELRPDIENECDHWAEYVVGCCYPGTRTEDEPRRIEPDAAFIPDAEDDDASHAEEQRRVAQTRWAEAE